MSFATYGRATFRAENWHLEENGVVPLFRL
jgi:hypothetical protein